MFHYKDKQNTFVKPLRDEIQYWRFHKSTGDCYRISQSEAHGYRTTASEPFNLKEKIANLTNQIKEGYTSLTKKEPEKENITDFVNEETIAYKSN